MSSTTVQRLTDARRALYNVQNIIDPDKVLLGNRRLIRAYLAQFSQQLRPVISLLPNVVRSDNLNITREIRNIRTISVSIADALEDREMSRNEGIRRTVDLIDQVRGVRRIIKRSIAEYREKFGEDEPTKPAKKSKQPVKIAVPPEADSRIELTAAPKFIPSKKFKSLEAFKQDYETNKEQYDGFIKTMQDQIRMAEGKPKEPQPNEERNPKIEHPDPYAPRENIEVVNTRHDKVQDETARQFQKIMHSVQPLLPKKPTFGKLPYRLVKSPVLVITQNFVMDSIWKQADMRISRPLGSVHPGFTLEPTNSTMSSPVVIIYDQMLVAMPLKDALDKTKFQEFMEYDLPQIGETNNKAVVIEIGGDNRRRLYDTKSPQFGLHKDTKDFQPLKPRAEPKPNVSGGKKKRLTPTQKAEQLKQLNLENERRIREANQLQQQRERESRQAQKKETKRVSSFEAGRRYFFVNKNYPGIAWMWLVSRSEFTKLSQVHFVSVNLPIAESLRKGTTVTIKSGPALVRKKEEDESRRDKTADKLSRARQRLTGDYSAELATLKNQQDRVLDKKRNLLRDIESEQDLVFRQTKQLKQTNPNDARYSQIEESIELATDKIEHLQGELDHLKKVVDPLIRTQQKKLETRIRAVVLDKAKQRRKARAGR